MKQRALGPAALWNSLSTMTRSFQQRVGMGWTGAPLLSIMLVVLLLPTQRTWGQLPSSRLDWLQPCGEAPGSSFELTVGGADLDEAAEIIFSHPGLSGSVKMTEATETAAATPVYGTFVVQIAGDVSPGIYEVRVAGRFGTSNTRRFMVDRLATVIDSGNNRQLDTAQTVAVGQVVDGRIEANARDYYRIELAENESITLEAIASAIDSRAKPVIEVLDLNGNELTRFRSAPGYAASGEFRAPFAGSFAIAVYDLVYAGSADHFYRLRIHRGPVITDCVPAIVPAGGVASVQVYGRQLGGSAQTLDAASGLQSVSVAVDANAVNDGLQAALGQALLPLSALDDLRSLAIRVEGEAGVSAQAPILVSDLPIIAEVESEDEWQPLATSQPITLPCIIDGRFGEARDRDWFEFSGKQGERWVIEVFSHRLGEPTDPLIAIHKVNAAEDGTISLQQLTVVDDNGDRAAMIGTDFDTTSDDPTLTFDVPADGTYRIALDDQFGGNREQAGVRYALRIRPLLPRIRVLVEPPRGRPGNDNQAVIGTVEVRRGGTEKLPIRIQRLEGADQPIELSVRGLPAGVTCEPITVTTTYNATSLVFVAAEDAAQWHGPVQVVGKYEVAGETREVVALNGTLAFGTDNRPARIASSRLSHDLALSVLSIETEPIEVRPQTIRFEGARGAKLTMPITLIRRNYDGAITLNPVGQHGELKMAPVAIEAGATEATLSFDMASPNLPPGKHQFVLQGDVTFKYVRNAHLIAAAQARQAEVQQQLEAAQGAGNEAEVTRLTELKAQADKSLEEVNKANQPADRVYTVVSPHIEVTIEPSPLVVQATGIEVQAGQNGQVPITIERRFGYEGPVTISANSATIPGLTLAGGELAADQNQLPLMITTTPETPAGPVVITVQATAKFNNLDVPRSLEIPITIVPAN